MTTVQMKNPLTEEGEWTLIFQGAESRVYRGTYHTKAAILKERFQKKYRLPELDQKLTKERIKAEVKAYDKIGKKCKTLAEVLPVVLYSDEFNIVFEEVSNAHNVSHYFNEHSDSSQLVVKMLHKMGVVVAQIHSCGIIHGDLTTSNFLVSTQHPSAQDSSSATEATAVLIPIDFGLSSSSTSDEDRAVDLYVLERAIQSTHPNIEFQHFLDSYQSHMGTDKVIKRLEQVRQRGRKRLMIG